MSILDEQVAPGWHILKSGVREGEPWEVWLPRCGAVSHYSATREVACRHTWDRFADGILGPVVWRERDGGGCPQVHYPRYDVRIVGCGPWETGIPEYWYSAHPLPYWEGHHTKTRTDYLAVKVDAALHALSMSLPRGSGII